MGWFVSYVRSSVGAKQVMAVTGLALLLFTLVHMLGHLGMFRGRDAYNTYAHTLQSLGTLKWLMRGGLLAVFVIHVASGLSLAAANRAARPVRYAVTRRVRTTIFARTMAITGLVILLFVVYHLCHFTLGWVQPDAFHQLDDKGRYDAYDMFIAGFRGQPVLLISYLVPVALLCAHLAHGASSWLQTLGLRHPRYDRGLELVGPVLAVILIVGYFAPPLAVAFHLITP